MTHSQMIPDYTWPMKNPEFSPFKHQVKTTEHMLANPRCFVLNDMGTGKTLAALWAADYLLTQGSIKRVLVVGPLTTLKSVWANEIKTNLPHIKYAVAHGKKPQDRFDAVNSSAKIVITNHDSVKSYEQLLLSGGFDLMIIDELTAFKTVSTKRWKSAKKIADKCKGVWGMTAEPTPNTPVEAFGQAKLVNDKNPFLPKYLTKFRDMVEIKIGMFNTIPKDDADKTVHKCLQPSIRFKLDDCVDIPDCQHLEMQIPLTPVQQAAYKSMYKDLCVEYSTGSITSSNAAVKFTKLLQIANGWVKNDDGGITELSPENRLQAAWEIFENTHKTKLVIAAGYSASIQGLYNFFLEKGVKVEVIQGATKQDDRAKYIDRFQNGDLQVLVIQPQAASHGITLTSASTLLWYGLVPSGEVYNQMNGRISRIGQKKKQSIIHFISSKAEARILKLLKNKANMSREILSLFDGDI